MNAKDIHWKVRMLELSCYGLTGLAALLVIVLGLTYVDEFQPVTAGSPRPRGAGGEQQETVPVSSPQTAGAETVPGTIYGDNVQSDQGQVEALHG